MFILVIGTPMVLLAAILLLVLDESPRFLVGKQRYQDARNVLDKISRYNRRPEFQFRLYQEIEAENQLLKQPKPRRRTLGMMIG